MSSTSSMEASSADVVDVVDNNDSNATAPSTDANTKDNYNELMKLPSLANDDNDKTEINVSEKPFFTSGVTVNKNRRHRRTMEDEHVIIEGFGGDPNQALYCVFDGHGGKKAAEAARIHFPNIFLDELNKSESVNVFDSLTKAFSAIDDLILNKRITTSGCTAVVGYVCVENLGNDVGNRFVLYTANCGDARVVISHAGTDADKITIDGAIDGAVRLSKDHVLSLSSEVKRINDTGGFITRNRVNGVLAVARSLGDHMMKVIVISTPYRTRTVLEPHHTHMVLACDGVWDVLSDADVINMAQTQLDDPKNASSAVVKQSIQEGSQDNVSCIVTVFDHSVKPSTSARVGNFIAGIERPDGSVFEEVIDKDEDSS